MSALDLLIPTPRLLELDHADLAIPAHKAWNILRHTDLGRHSAIVRALFALRTAPNHSDGEGSAPILKIDELVSTPAAPGFQILSDQPPRELVVGAIGKVWKLDIPFVHVEDARAFEAFALPDFAKVAWAVRVLPLGEHDSRIEIEVRVDTTDEASWIKFRRYFRLIGPGSRFIRHAILSSLAREHGTPFAKENERPLAGDELLPDATEQITQAIDIEATPGAIWPWLVQMGAHRAGFYSIDLLDNENVRSARELLRDLPPLSVGEVIPATRTSKDGFEVLRLEPDRALVLGGLFDRAANRQLRFSEPRPERFWQVTWSFVLERRDETTTRLHARVRAKFSASAAFHAAWIRPVHRLMQATQLKTLAALAEHRTAKDDWRDVGAGASGAAIIAAAFLTPFMRSARRHWGLDAAEAERYRPGDELIAVPTWDWTHGIEIAAPAEEVWPWVAQIGADRGGFYSYQWLENLVGCDVKNADTVHAELALGPGAALSLHPKMPPLPVVLYERGSHIVVHAKADEAARAQGKPWVETTWGFYVEAIAKDRTRFVSRYRCLVAPDTKSQLQYGALTGEPIGFAMDRRMLLGLKERAEEARRHTREARRT